MKKLFTLSLLFAFIGFAHSQIVWQQDFEGDVSDVIMVNNDGLTPAANVSAYVDAWNVTNVAFGNGTNVAISNSWYAPPGAADDWMISPALDIQSATTVLAWEAKAQDPNFADGYEVRVSTNGTDLTDFVDVLYSTPGEMTDWQQRQVSLAPYQGQTIHIAFRNNSFDKFLLLVDNIIVAALQANDARLASVTTTRFHELTSQVTIEGVVQNVGGSPLTSFDLHWTDGTNTYTDNITGVNVASGADYAFSHTTTFTVNDPVSYDLNVSVDNPNGMADGDPSNNALDAVISGVTYIPAKKMVAEEATGTWCGWCPRGSVWMDIMVDNYHDQFVGIAVHNQDPMANSVYDSGLTSFPGFTGFPSVIVDRVEVTDPSQLEAVLPTYTSRISPIAPDITASLDVASKSASIDVSAEYVTQLDNMDYRFNVVLTEDGVTGTGNGYNQVNYYSGGAAGQMGGYENLPDPVPAADMVYEHVGRDILGGWAGFANSMPVSAVAGDIATQSYSYSVPGTWAPKNMHAIVLILDNASGEVLNAEERDIEIICPASLALAATVVDESVPNAGDGSISIAAGVGFAPYTYADTDGNEMTLTGLSTGDYEIVVTDGAGCSEVITVHVGLISDVNDIEALNSFSLAPNPTSGYAVLNVNFNKYVDMTVQVVDVMGKVVYETANAQTRGGSYELDLNNNANGVYFVKLIVDNQVHTERLMLNH